MDEHGEEAEGGPIEMQGQGRCAEPSQMQVISTISPNFGAQKPLKLFYSNVKANIGDYPANPPHVILFSYNSKIKAKLKTKYYKNYNTKAS